MTDSLTDGRLDELEALAANATPGPWHWREDERELLAPWAEVVFGSDDDPEEADAEFIAAANPVTVRALIARVREAEAKLEQVRALASANNRLRDSENACMLYAPSILAILDQTKDGEQ